MSARTETATCTRRILRAYASADAETVSGGREWYPAAERFCAQLADAYGYPLETVAAVFAVLSPQSQLGPHAAATSAAVAAAARMRGDFLGDLGTVGAVTAAANTSYPVNRVKAGRILAGEPAAQLATGPKVSAFWRACAGDRDAVALDVWAMRAAYGARVHPTPRRLRVAAAAYRAAAARVGESPRDLQAIVWCAVRGFKPADPDWARP